MSHGPHAESDAFLPLQEGIQETNGRMCVTNCHGSRIIHMRAVQRTLCFHTRCVLSMFCFPMVKKHI